LIPLCKDIYNQLYSSLLSPKERFPEVKKSREKKDKKDKKEEEKEPTFLE
jgi:hypothetical protein